MSGPPESLPTEPPVLRRLDTPGAAALVQLTETFEELQTVLRCCERLVAALAAGASDASGDGPGDRPDDVLVEAVWTMALLSYARCFAPGGAADGSGPALTEEDLSSALSPSQGSGNGETGNGAGDTGAGSEVVDWHTVLLQLRDHYADARVNPRERFSVGVAQDRAGSAEGIAITSARQPLVDDLTVRQTGAIAFALSGLVNDRIAAQQKKVFEELKGTSKAELDKLPQLEVTQPDAPG